MPADSALIVINQHARQGETALNNVLEIFRDYHIDFKVVTFTDISVASQIIRDNMDQVDRIVVGGGDGSLNAVLEALLASNLPLGILPMGTANDLARTLHIPTSLIEAARVIAKGTIQRIDLGLVNEKYFFNVANMGLAAKVAHSVSRKMKKNWGSLAYLFSFFEVYRLVRPFVARVNCDGRTSNFKSIQISIGNGRYYGGGMAIRNSATIDDNRLHAYSLEPHKLWQLIVRAPSIISGTFKGMKNVQLFDGQKIEITTSRPLRIDTDGELTTTTPALFQVIPQALPIYVPVREKTTAKDLANGSPNVYQPALSNMPELIISDSQKVSSKQPTDT